jgi:methylglyoxal synthase
MTRVALIAHDDEKPELIDLATEYQETLASFDLIATGTTGKRVIEETELDVERKASGPLGGDMMIGAEVAEDEVDAIIFLRDPLTAQPHEPDITALLRICDVHDTPLATTRTAAEYVLDGLARDG